MKPVVFLLVLFLSACASQNNTPAPQQSHSKPKPTKQSTETLTNQAKQTTATAEKKAAPEQINQESTTTNVANNASTAKKPIESKKPDPNSFTCIYDSIYKVYAASSVETDGGKFLVNIDKDKLTVKSLSSEIPGTFQLQLQRRDRFKIYATTKSKQFIYSLSSGNFVFNTGIGPSGFNISKGGHTGRQMRASGKCVNN